jgi:hypothetical protein
LAKIIGHANAHTRGAIPVFSSGLVLYGIAIQTLDCAGL